MLGNESEYDTGVNTFSPEGRIYQIEYAMNASKLGSSGVGLVCKNGVVFATEKKSNNPLVEKSGFDKLCKIDEHVFCIVSGLVADSRKLIETARSEAHYHRFLYREPINIKSLTQSVADLALNFGEGDITTKKKPIARPYGVSLLLGGIDKSGPNIYQMDPSGTMIGYLAKGLGSAEEGIQHLLDQHYVEGMDVKDGEKLALAILKQVMEDKINEKRVDLIVMENREAGFVKREEEYLKDLLTVVKDLS